MSEATVLVIEHEDKCPPALVGDWLAEAGCALEVCRPWAGDDVPALAAYDGFLVLGGPMGADDDAKHAWLTPVKERVRDAVSTGLPTLGICLGHQLIAVALGGTVGRNPRGQQLGLLEVAWTDAALDDELVGPLASPRRGVQWNDDVVTRLPDGATLLAATGAGEVQAARFAPTVWGVQLHPEVDVEVLRPWAESDRGSHEARGIDQDALLGDIAGARAELDDAWRPLAAGFAALVRRRHGRRG
ncbi:type 1 glutamine amidotransferase [Nocardioides ungokensis]|uniref:type 1 glutamine amidotransferase n=1 Tax=Nocardioides ungokensis TaxID=1643322 RepID=UPI0015DF2C45|nr:type 1 glutamine amidotransferase [Nocardioides ungokensis]